MMPKFYTFLLLLALHLLTENPTLHAQCAAAATPTPVTCFQASDGSISLAVTNGTAPYTWLWSQNGTPQAPFSEAGNQLDITDLAAGTYAFTVTDDTGCTATATAVITQPAALEFAAFALNLPCGGEFSGKIKLDVTGGQAAPYSVAWSNGTASGSKNGIPGEPFTLGGLGEGTYTVTLTNANGCSATTSASLSSAAPLVLTTEVANLSCFGGSNGSIDLTISGGTPGYTTGWSNGNTTPDMTNLTPGTYTATVSDANGCSATTSATVGEPTRLKATAAVTNVVCFGEQTGAIDLSAEGGTPPYAYAWAHTVNTQDAQNLSSGTYTVTVVDANGCTATTSATVGQPAAPQSLSMASRFPPSTCAAADGTLTLEAPVGSQQPYAFAWSNGMTTGNGSGLVLSGLAAGPYSVTLTDGQGCTSSAAVALNSQMAAIPASSPTSTCTAQDGAIQISMLGNFVAPFNYTWRHGTLTGNGSAANPDFDINDLPQGDYTVEVRDDAGCFASAQVNVGQGATNLTAIATASPTSCGQNNGLVTASVSGGMPVFGFLWSTGDANPTVGGLAPGTYTVTVTEGGSGCTATASATVGASTSNISNLTATPIAANCNGFNGGIVVNATGAVAPIIVRWKDAGGLSSGIQTVLALPYTIPNVIPNIAYTITLTDERGCTATASTTVSTVGPAFDATATATAPSSCAAADGSIQVNISGGTQPFAYSWSGGSQTGNGSGVAANALTINGLKPGWHSITLTDGLGCQDFVDVEVKNPTGFGFGTVAVAPTGCTGSDGAILVEISGGAAPYSYKWWRDTQQGSGDNIATGTFSIPNLAAGEYYLTIKSGDCAAVEPLVVLPQPVMVMANFTVVPAVCGGNNGNVDLSVTGGTGPYTYNWSHLPGTNDPQDLSNVAPGTYAVVITEAAGCSATATVQVGGSLALNVFATPTQASTCATADGAISLIVTGGTPPFQFNWNHLPGTNDPEDLTGLLPSTYVVTVTDAAGCTAIRNSTVGSVLLQVTAFTSASSCNGQPTGSITVDFTSPSGAVPPYSYAWTKSGGGTGNGSNIAAEPFQITGLVNGTYTITVTNGLGCSRVLTVNVFQGSNINFQSAPAVVGVRCLGSVDGAISIVMSGGTTPYNYNWAGPGGFTSTQQNINNLIAGNYRVTVTDALGCTFASNNIAVGSPAALAIQTVANNPVKCFDGSDGAISVAVFGGIAPYTVQWSGPNGYTGTGASISGLKGGLYTPTVTDAKGCTQNGQPINVQTPMTAMMANASTCFNGTVGNIWLGISNGNLPYTVQWTGPNGYTGSGTFITNLAPGLYTPIVVDANGCTVTTQPINAEQTNMVISIAPTISYLDCHTAIVNVTINDPIQSLTYLWNTNDNGSVLTVPAPSTYTVTVTNAFCGLTAAQTILVKPCGQIAGSVLNDLNKNCMDNNEPGLGSWIVKAEGAQTYYGTSKPNGQYNIQVEPGHLYTVSAVAPNTMWTPCLASNTVVVAQQLDSVAGGDFLFKKPIECPMLTVDLGSGNLRRCFSNNYYNILYCNEGTAAATDAYIVVTLDAYLTPVSSSLPGTNIGNNRYRFNVGNLAVGQCGSILLFVKLDCNAPFGATHCSEAHIYPDTLCEPPNLQWSGASLRIRSECKADSVHFVLKNVGTADMVKSLEYIVIEDLVMMMKATIQLDAGDSSVVKVPARGTTWRLEVEQEAFHPGLSRPASVVEGCNASTTFSTGMVNVFPPDDADKFIDIDCRENTAAYDPNDKQAVPTGYGTAHYVEPNTPLTYTIRFQNTGNDTAFTVVLRDTLSTWLDPATVRPGASSHPYSWDLSGTGNLTFTFENILLPDTATNLDASQGFVQYTIWPKDSVPLESQVLNRAGIYFDFNPPIITNQTLHTLGRNFIVSSTWHPERPQYKVQVMPNPMGDEARLTVLGLPRDIGNFRLQVYDLQGNAVRDVASTTPAFVLRKEGLPSGIYFFRVLAEGALVGSGKVVVGD